MGFLQLKMRKRIGLDGQQVCPVPWRTGFPGSLWMILMSVVADVCGCDVFAYAEMFKKHFRLSQFAVFAFIVSLLSLLIIS